MTEGASSAPRAAEPLGYAGADLYRRPPLVTAVAVTSICVACLTLLGNCIAEHSAVSAMRQAIQAPARVQQMQKMAALRAQRVAAAIKAAASQPATMRALTQTEISHTLRYINNQLRAAFAAIP